MNLNGKTILVTGGTGSFGRKFTEIVLEKYRPKKLIIFSRDELKQHEMRQDFIDKGSSPLRYFIGDVRDKERLARAFHGVDIVVHAAALKQVPACEYNPFEAVQTNVIGAKNVIDAAIDQNVENVMAISTDKAVNPINIYGATKLCSEKIFVQANAYSGQGGTKFSICRYGNVVGSRGSVVPVFRDQVKSGIITITDNRMTRFWLTLKQGIEFVQRCIGMMNGGEIFVPKIPSVRVVDLARVIAPECDVKLIGIRPGEKLHEALVSPDESRQTLDADGAYIVEPAHPWWKIVKIKDTKPVPEGFSYTSDQNSHWLSESELEKQLMELTDERG